MNIGNVGNTYGTYNYTSRAANRNANKSFETAIGNVTNMPGPNLTLHMSKEGDVEKSVGSWANPNAGRSVAIYERLELVGIERRISSGGIAGFKT